MRHKHSLLLFTASFVLLGITLSSPPAEAKPTQSKPTQSKPTQSKPTQVKPARPKSTPPSPAAQKAANDAFKAGSEFMEKEQYKQALVEFQKVLEIAPDEPNTLWNAASAAQLSHNYKVAATYFERDRKVEPYNGQALAKLVQTYQALGDLPQRDARRTQLFALHKNGRDDSGYSKHERYCRDQFTVNGDSVFAFEYFDLKPRDQQHNPDMFGVRYEFDVFDPKGAGDAGPKMRLEVGWNTLESDGKGGFRPSSDEFTSFYFDAYYATGTYSRKTFALLPKEISYDEAKKELLAIANGKANMISGRRRDEAGSGD